MFSDPIFRAAVGVSLLAHLAFVVPHGFFFPRGKTTPKDPANLNYIVIEEARLTEDNEVYTPEASKEEKAEEYVEKEVETFSGEVKTEKATEIKRQEAFLKYYNLIREKIRAEIYSSFKRRETGEVRVTFVLSSDGHLLSIAEAVSGSSSVLKKKAIEGVKEAQPFPPFPKEMRSAPINFSLTIRFNSK